jgi:hypothetical protein
MQNAYKSLPVNAKYLINVSRNHRLAELGVVRHAANSEMRQKE